jgi:hypothetical protein
VKSWAIKALDKLLKELFIIGSKSLFYATNSCLGASSFHAVLTTIRGFCSVALMICIVGFVALVACVCFDVFVTITIAIINGKNITAAMTQHNKSTIKYSKEKTSQPKPRHSSQPKIYNLKRAKELTR